MCSACSSKLLLKVYVCVVLTESNCDSAIHKGDRFEEISLDSISKDSQSIDFEEMQQLPPSSVNFQLDQASVSAAQSVSLECGSEISSAVGWHSDDQLVSTKSRKRHNKLRKRLERMMAEIRKTFSFCYHSNDKV